MEETKIDRDTMARLARALAFIRSPDDPVVVALRRAAETGIERDIKQARTLFLKLKPADRRAALASLTDLSGAPTAAAIQAWRRAWEEVIPFFAFSPEIRRVIYTTSAVESLNRVIRKAIKTRGSFPSEDAA
jgi:transposase-like protein